MAQYSQRESGTTLSSRAVAQVTSVLARRRGPVRHRPQPQGMPDRWDWMDGQPALLIHDVCADGAAAFAEWLDIGLQQPGWPEHDRGELFVVDSEFVKREEAPGRHKQVAESTPGDDGPRTASTLKLTLRQGGETVWRWPPAPVVVPAPQRRTLAS